MLADPELRDLAAAEYAEQKDAVPRLEREVQLMLLPKDAADERSAILEVRPAAGGGRGPARRVLSRPPRAPRSHPAAPGPCRDP